MPQADLRAIKRLLRVIASGGRLVMREYARIKEVSEGEARELRQLSIAQFTKASPRVHKERKQTTGKADPNNAPVNTIWGASDRSSECRLEWRGRIQCTLLMDPIPAIEDVSRSGIQLLLPGALPPLSTSSARRTRKNKGVPPFFPWSGLNWYNIPIAPTLGGQPTSRLAPCKRPKIRTMFRP